MAYNDALAQLEALGNQTFKKKKKKQQPSPTPYQMNLIKGVNVPLPEPPKPSLMERISKPLPASVSDVRVIDVGKPNMGNVPMGNIPMGTKTVSTRLQDNLVSPPVTRPITDLETELRTLGLPSSQELLTKKIDPGFAAKHPIMAKAMLKVTVPADEAITRLEQTKPGQFVKRTSQTAGELITGQPHGTYGQATTGNKAVDIIADLIGTAGGFMTPQGIASQAMAPSRTLTNIPKVSSTLARVPEKFAKPAERALSGTVGGATFGTAQGLAEGGDIGEVAQRAGEDALIFGALEVGLPYIGEALKRVTRQVGIRINSTRAGKKIQPLEDFTIVSTKTPERLMEEGWTEFRPGSGLWTRPDPSKGGLDQYYETVVTLKNGKPTVTPKYEIWRQEQRGTQQPTTQEGTPLRDIVDRTPEPTGLAISGKVEPERSPIGDIGKPIVATQPEGVAYSPYVGELGRVKVKTPAKVDIEAPPEEYDTFGGAGKPMETELDFGDEERAISLQLNASPPPEVKPFVDEPMPDTKEGVEALREVVEGKIAEQQEMADIPAGNQWLYDEIRSRGGIAIKKGDAFYTEYSENLPKNIRASLTNKNGLPFDEMADEMGMSARQLLEQLDSMGRSDKVTKGSRIASREEIISELYTTDPQFRDAYNSLPSRKIADEVVEPAKVERGKTEPKPETEEPVEVNKATEHEKKTHPPAPAELKRNVPRLKYQGKQFKLEFESDVDKALNLVVQIKKSKHDKKYMNWLTSIYGTEEEVISKAIEVRKYVLDVAKRAEDGTVLFVPESSKRKIMASFNANPAEVKPEPVKPTDGLGVPKEGKPKEADKPPKQVAKLRKVADNMQKSIDDKFSPKLANTPKRAREAASAVQEGERLQRVQQTLRNIADGIEGGEVELLTSVDSKAQVEMLDQVLNTANHKRLSNLPEKVRDIHSKYQEEKNKPYSEDDIRYAEMPMKEVYYSYLERLANDISGQKEYMQTATRLKKAVTNAKGDYVKVTPKLREDIEKGLTVAKDNYINQFLQERKRLERMGIQSEEELWAYLREYIKYRGKSNIDPKQKAIKEKELAIVGRKFEGYFPTPKAVVDKMLDAAEISEGMTVLEPSAGKGNIADAIGNPDVIEIVPELQEILTDKGHNLVANDFMKYTDKEYDRIVMNPPFEKGQDIDHVRHAYELLKPGGRIVSIMSEGPFFRGDKKAVAFREWLDEIGTSEKLPEGSFKTAERSTGVNTRMVVIDKEASAEIKKKTVEVSPKDGIIETQPQKEVKDNEPIITDTGSDLGGYDTISKREAEKDKTATDGIVNPREHIKVSSYDDVISEYPELNNVLYAHQKDGANIALTALKSKGGFLLADGAGAGKTRQGLAVSYIRQKQGAKRILILTERDSVIKDAWLKEAKAMFGDNSHVKKWTPKSEGDGVFVATYSKLRTKSPIPVDNWDLVILDECHNLKNTYSSQQAKQGIKLIENTKEVMFVSATPYDRLQEFLYLGRKLGEFTTQGSFERWLAGYGIGTRKREVATPRGTITVPEYYRQVPVDEMVKNISRLGDRLTAQGTMVKREVSMKGLNVEVRNIELPNDAYITMGQIEQRFSNKGLDQAHVLNAMRRHIENYKITPAVEIAKEALENSRQVAIFTGYKEGAEIRSKRGTVLVASEPPIRELREALEKTVGKGNIAEIHGGLTGESAPDVEAEIKAYQSGKKKVAIATMDMGSTGISLHDETGKAPRTQIMLTLPWSALKHVQTAGRSHRLTSRSNTDLIVLTSDTPIDERLTEVITAKLQSLGAMVGGDIKKLNIDRGADYAEAGEATLKDVVFGEEEAEKVIESKVTYEAQTTSRLEAELREITENKMAVNIEDDKISIMIGSGYDTAPNKWGKEDTKPGTVKVVTQKNDKLMDKYVALRSAYDDKDSIKNVGGVWGPSVGGFKNWYLPIEHIPELFKEFKHGEISTTALKKYEALFGNEVTVIDKPKQTHPLDGIGVQGFAGKREMKPNTQQAQTEPIRKKDIIDFLSEKLDIPVRVGKYRKPGAKGIFKVRPEVIRTKLAEDIEVTAHEVGHYLDKKLGLSQMPFEAEMKQLAKGFKGDERQEGTAQFINFYLTNPTKAEKLAPRYYKAFQQKMDENPEIVDILEQAQAQIKTWLEQPSKARVLGSLSVGEGTPKRPMNFDRLYTKFVDELHPLEKAVKDISGGNVEFEQNPFYKAWLSRGWRGKAETMLHYGVMDKDLNKVGKSLDEIIKPVDKDLDDFRAFIVSKRVLELSKRQIETGIEPADAKQAIREMIKDLGIDRVKEFNRTLKELVKFQDASMEALVDAGMLSPTVKAEMRKMNRDYVPFYRIFDETGTLNVSGKTFGNLRSPVKKMKGSTRTIVDPLESIIKNTYTFINLAERNEVGRMFVELAEKFEGTGKWIEKLPTPTHATQFQLNEIEKVLSDAGVDLADVDLDAMAAVFRPSSFVSKKDNTLTVYRNGKPEYFQLDPDLYRAFLFLDKESTNILSRLFSYPTSVLRAGATLTPEFMARNPARDQFSAFINSKYGFVPGVDLIRGLAHVLKKDDLYWKWYQSGGAHSAFVSVDRDYLQKNLNAILNGHGAKAKFKNTLMHPLEVLRGLSELTEEATRVQEFAKGLKKEGPQKAGRAALASRDLTVDFSRAGTIGKEANRWIAFLNAQIQDMDKIARQFKSKPFETTMKVLLSITLPSFILYAINKDNEWYKERPRWEKDTFWLIPTDGKNFARIPKPFTLGILFGTIPERFMEYVHDNDPKAFDDLYETIKKNILFDAVPDKEYMGFPPGMMPTALVPVMELWANKSSFTGYDIVPQREQGLAPEMQYNAYTSETARVIGKALNVSPRKVDHLVYGYTAGLGRNIVAGLDGILHAAGVGKDRAPAKGLTDIPLVKGFVAKELTAGQSVTVDNFYDLYNETEELYKTANAKVKAGKKIKLTKEEIAKLRALKEMRNINGYLSDMRGLERKILDSNKISPQQKRDAIQSLDIAEINYVRKKFGMEPLK